MSQGSKIFVPSRGLGYVSNHIPLQVRYIKSRKENLIITCVGKSFHTYGVSHFGLLSVSGLHAEDITCLSSDAFHVYTACQNNIYAWRRGNELKHTYRGHKAPVHLMIPFGAHLISVDEDSVVKVWDIKAETVFLELTFSNREFRITTVLHPSTYLNKVLFGSDKGQMQLWNLNTAKQIHVFKGWKHGITCLEQAPALDVVAVGLVNGKIILHNLKYDETIMEFTQDWGMVTSITFRSDGCPIMATGSTCGHIVFWDLEQRRVASQLQSAHNGSVTGLACLPNEPLIVSSSSDNSLKLWIFDMSDGGARLLRIREGHSSSPAFIRYHGANGHNILSASSDSTLKIFNTQNEQFNKNLGRASYNRKISKKRGRLVEDPLIMPPIVEFTSETTREKEWDDVAAIHLGIPMVTTWSYDKLKMGEHKLLPERFQKKKLDVRAEPAASSLCLTHCGNFVIVGYSTGHVDRFNMQSGLWRDSYGNPKAHKKPVRGITSDSYNQIVVTGASDGIIKFWRFKNNGTDPISSLTLDESIRFFRSHRENSMLAVALEDFTIVVVDLDTQRVVRKFEGHSAQLTDATISPDARWLITASMDCSIRTWDVPAAQLVDQFAVDSACTSISMSPNALALITSHVDYLGIFLWVNRTLFSKVTLKPLSVNDELPLVKLPECQQDKVVEETEVKEEEVEYESPEQLSKDLVSLSGLSTSRWANLLDIDEIRKKNKPKAPAKAPKAAPFFLPTVASLNMQFDLTEIGAAQPTTSKIILPESVLNFTEFGKMLHQTKQTEDFLPVINHLKTLGPTMINYEIKSLAPEGGGTIELMLQFLKILEFIFKSNKDFELGAAYLNVFLKSHSETARTEESLRNYLRNVAVVHDVCWKRMEEKMLYCMSVIKHMKSMSV